MRTLVGAPLLGEYKVKGYAEPSTERWLWIFPKYWTLIEYFDWSTRWFLLVVGALLIVGLFTRLSCFSAAGFLLLTILTQLSVPWLPAAPNNEGSYLFVNKNVIEMLALLALMTTRTGRWFGLDAIAIAVLADLVRQMLLARQIASGDPVAVTQRRLERLRIMRIRHEQGVLLVSTLAWTPFLIVVFEGLFHVNALRVFDRWWMAGNVLFGLAVPGITYLVARRLPDRVRPSPALQRLLDDLSGRHLKQARAFLSELHDLESPTVAREC